MLAAAIVFLIAGLTASAEEIRRRRRLQRGLGIAVAATIAVMVPLADNSIARHGEQEDASAIRSAVEPELAAQGSTVEGVTVERRSNDARVALEIAGPERPDPEELAGTVATELGEPVELALLWRFGERAQAEP